MNRTGLIIALAIAAVDRPCCSGSFPQLDLAIARYFYDFTDLAATTLRCAFTRR